MSSFSSWEKKFGEFAHIRGDMGDANGNLACFSCFSKSQINLFVMISLKKVTDKAEVKKRIV